MKTLFAAVALAAAPALAMPSEIHAEYRLTNNGITIGHVEESFVRRGDTYRISSVSRAEGILKMLYDEQITLESAGRIVDGNLQPLRFDERRVKDPKRGVNAVFDWDQGVLRSEFRGETSLVPLPRETQDRISIMYQFMNMPTHQGTFVILMSNGRKVEHYSYRLVNEVRIKTPAGEFDTFHFERVTYSPKESRAEVWLAKDRDNFPVKVVFDDPKGLRLEQDLIALQTR
ncbi:MAG TPA: DUF3108 domain-containing protein [Usitatibacter sp.]|nr:DUF3108 domain-containing protein [Usitatibacter sp.]